MKGNAIKGFVRSSRLSDGWARINEQMKEGASVREGCPFLNCLFRDYRGEHRGLFISSIHGQRLSLSPACERSEVAGTQPERGSLVV